MKQYEMFELKFHGSPPEDSQVTVDMTVEFMLNGSKRNIKGFYAGDGVYKVRYYPQMSGNCSWKVISKVTFQGETQGEEKCLPAGKRKHGMVRADGLHFKYEDGVRYQPFGTTVYALVHQDESLINQTMQTLKSAPFNKIRFCVFPKSYDFNHNEPQYFAFEKTDGKWDVNRPCFPFWDALEKRINELMEMGIEGDLILFHGYDRWGFSEFSREEGLIYLDYLLRRLSAFPNLWWSLANEYEILTGFEKQWWYDFAEFIHSNDPYGHLLSNHNFLKLWDFADSSVTHCSIQDSNVIRVPELQEKYEKPVIFDECCYEGNIIHQWGNLSGFEMTNRFWTTVVMGGYCTHGETFMSSDDILWWSKGGVLHGKSPERIAFLRSIMEELPGDLDYCKSLLESAYDNKGISLPENPHMETVFNMIVKELDEVSDVRRQDHLDKERMILGHCKEDAYIRYMGRQCAGEVELQLPKTGNYDVEVIDVWEMTRTSVMSEVNGNVRVALPGKEGIAVLARRR